MTPIQIGILGCLVMVLLFALSVPVAVSMVVVGALGFAILVSPEAALNILVTDFFSTFTSYSFTTMPLFVLMGTICFYSNISKKLYDCAYTMLGSIRGGLAIATVAACALFGAISGSSNAAAASMGRVCLPEMKRYNYDDSLSTASVAAAGCLGILIPPSGIMIIYGVQTEQNISTLFMAGLVPGIILTILMCITVNIICRRNPQAGPAGEKTSWGEKIKSMNGIFDMLILFIVCIGGMQFGWFTPTQGGAIGAFGAIVLGRIRKTLSWADCGRALKETAEMSCMVLAICAGATVFGHFMAVSRIPATLSSTVASLNVPHFAVMIVIMLIYLLGGCFMDSLALIMLTVPIFYPVVTAMGYSPIWFGVIIVICASMGLITPPVGLNVYIIGNQCPEIGLPTIFKGIWPYLIDMFILTVLLMIFPQLTTWCA